MMEVKLGQILLRGEFVEGISQICQTVSINERRWLFFPAATFYTEWSYKKSYRIIIDTLQREMLVKNLLKIENIQL